jgi:hypothetical protein
MLAFTPNKFILACALALPSLSSAFTTDGSGHYALRGEWQNNPGMNSGTGLHQAIAQSCRLLGEVRANDRSSFFLELRLFQPNGQSYLGNKALSPQCRESGVGSADCPTDYQSVNYPGYHPLQPDITKAYARYAFDYFILEAGRRGRQWGLGIFLDAGEGLFAPSASVYDGVSFDINLQQMQTLGFSFGYDKLAETGAAVRPVEDSVADKRNYGPASTKDDIDQVFLSIAYDDRKVSAGAPFTKEIGIYAARVHSGEVSKGGSSTELTFFDVFANLNLKSFNLKHETIITLGKSADPNVLKLGGSFSDSEGEPAVNKLNTVAFAGTGAWSLARSGAYSGPAEYLEGDYSEHVVFANYAFAPGDTGGYYNDRRSLDVNNTDDKYRALQIGNRTGSRANAWAFHRNFKPALILFSGREYVRDLAVDGIFDPGQFMNAQLYSLGYRYESLAAGQVEVQAIYSRLNAGMQADVASYYSAHPGEKRPIGYAGKELGVELDVSYTKKLSRNFNYGAATGYLFSGDAWKVYEDEKAANSFLAQVFMGFQF